MHDPVTWYKITHAGEQVAQWDFQNKGRSRWTGTSCFVLEDLLLTNGWACKELSNWWACNRKETAVNKNKLYTCPTMNYMMVRVIEGKII